MKKFASFLLFCLMTCPALAYPHKQGRPMIDSLEQARNHGNLSQKEILEVLIAEASEWCRINNTMALSTAGSAEMLAKKLMDSAAFGRLAMINTIIYQTLDSIVLTYQYARTAILINSQFNHEYLAASYAGFALLNPAQNPEQNKGLFYESVKALAYIHDPLIYIRSLSVVAALSMYTAPSSSRWYIDRSLDEAMRYGYPGETGIAYFRLSLWFMQHEHEDSALHYHMLAEPYLLYCSYYRMLVRSSGYIASTVYLNRYRKTKDPADAAAFLRECYKCLGYIKYYPYPKSELDLYSNMYRYYVDGGHTDSAFKYLQLYNHINNDYEQTQIVQDLQRRNFESEMALLSKEKKLQETDLNNKVVQGRILIALSVSLVVIAFLVYRSFRKEKAAHKLVDTEKRRSDGLLLNILPAEVAEELKNTGAAYARQFDNVTVLFTDFVNFSILAERTGPQQLVSELDACFRAFDEIMEKHGIEKIKTVGDAYLAVCGLPKPVLAHAVHTIDAALEIIEFMARRRQEKGSDTFEIRVGIHSGSVVAGIVGVKKFAYDIWGDTVNTAARMEQNSEPGRVNISETTWTQVNNVFECSFRGELPAKNKGLLKMFFVEHKK